MSVIKTFRVFKGVEVQITTEFLLIAVLAAFIFLRLGDRKQYLDFAESLDRNAVAVDGENLTLQDLAFYIAFEEMQVEKDAYVYNPENTKEYWDLYSNGVFIRNAAKKAAMDMAVHDKIFYDMACGQGLELDEEEEKRLHNAQYDFWHDLEEEQRAWLGVSQEALNESLRKLALAEKYQSIYAQMHDGSMEDYSFEGEAYKKLLERHEVTVLEDVWDGVHFGHITVHHKKE